MIHRRVLGRIEHFSRHHPTLVFVVAGLGTACALFLGRGLRLDADVLGMLPEGGEVGRFVRSVRDFGSLDDLLVLLKAPRGQSMEDCCADVADGLARRLKTLPEIDHVDDRVDFDSPPFRFLRRNAPLFLDDEGLEAFARALSDEQIRARVARLRSLVRAPMSMFAMDLLRRDPLGLMPIYFSRVLARHGGPSPDVASGAYLSEDGTAQLLIAKPVKPPQDVEFSKRLEAAVTRCFEEAKAEAARKRPGAAPPTMELGGGYVIAIDDEKLITADITFNATTSFLLVTGLYLFCYRRIAAIVYSVAPLLVGQALTFGLAVLVLGELSAATAGFTAMLMGLGTDFTIVMYARYVEERLAGATLASASRRMMGETALGVFTGALTSAGTFGAVCISRFPVLQDFGFLIGSGILVCMVAILFLIPAMIAAWEGRRGARPTTALYLHSFGFERLLLVVDRAPRATLLGSLLVTVAAAIAASGIQSSSSLSDMRPRDDRGFLVQEEVALKFGGSFDSMMIVCHGKTEDEAADKAASLARRLDRWVASGDLKGYESLATYVPERAAQEKVLARLAAGRGGAFDPARIRATIDAALAEQGFRAGVFDDAVGELVEALALQEPVSLADARNAGFDRLLERLERASGGEYRVATFVFPGGKAFEDGVPDGFVPDVKGGDPTIDVTGFNLAGPLVRRMFREDATRAFLIGFVLVALLLLLDFRSVRLTLYGLLQLGVGIVWLLGLMRVCGITLSLISAFATTMILGVGIDYGIHLIHRISEEQSLTNRGVLETAKAVVMASLTNVAGFGTVALSAYPGIRDMGLVSMMGTIACLLTALTLLPALLKLFPAPRTTGPGPQGS